jgi:hypothetical protein
MTAPKHPQNKKLFDREMCLLMLTSPRFGKAIVGELTEPSLCSKDVSLLTESEWDDIENACQNVFTSVAPTVCVGVIPEGMEDSFNEDPMPRVIGCDGVFVIWDVSGFGLSEEWFTCAEDAISAASFNWTEFSFPLKKKRKSRAKTRLDD